MGVEELLKIAVEQGINPVLATTPLGTSILPNLDKNLDRLKATIDTQQYKKAMLLVPKGDKATWLVFWYNYNPVTEKLERVKKTFDLNRIDNKKERKQQGEAYCVIVNMLLQRGYNHFTYDPDNTGQAKPAGPTLRQAITRALRNREMGKKDRTVSSYRSHVNIFLTWAKENDVDQLPVASFTADLFTDYLHHKQVQGHSGKNINDHISFFRGCFEQAKKMKYITDNPLTDIEFLPEHESTKFEPLTEAEIELIVPALIAYNPRLYLFVKFIPYELMRPHHIGRLQAKQIDYVNDIIKLTPDTTKNNKVTNKELLPGLKQALIALGCDKLRGETYLFGKGFLPAKKLWPRISIDAAEEWGRVVKAGLGIDKNMYALKHTSGQYLVQNNNNFDLKFLQMHMEHHSLTQTEVYLQGRIVKRLPEGAKVLKF